jgi:1-deoxy-D-xylulose-5-phosphate synthase
MGGFGAFVLHFLAKDGLLDRGLKVRTLTLPDIFQEHDKPERQYAQAGLDADGIVNQVLAVLGRATDAAGTGWRA